MLAPMPGYTIDELKARRLNPVNAKWCSFCRLWWLKRGYKRHYDAELRRRGLPPSPRAR